MSTYVIKKGLDLPISGEPEQKIGAAPAPSRVALLAADYVGMKPTMYVANVAENGFRGNPLLEAVQAHTAQEGAPVVAISAAIEAQIADLADEDKQVFLGDMGQKRSRYAAGSRHQPVQSNPVVADVGLGI